LAFTIMIVTVFAIAIIRSRRTHYVAF